MFNSFVQWMLAPGMWNDGVVFLGVLVIVLTAAMIVSEKRK